MSTRSHPIRQLLDVVAMGHEPSPAELDSLNLTAEVRSTLEALIVEILAAVKAGDRQEARRLVTEYSPALEKAAPTAGPYVPPETDPTKAAAQIPRF